jgi:hypothetical protein
MSDYKKYYYLEQYLFKEVRNKFHSNGFLTAEDFFCIVIWKSNRSKSRIKNKIKLKSTDVHKVIKILTSELFVKNGSKERLKYLLSDCGFSLPMASAILTVLYPDDFTVYDYRVCNMLNGFHNLKNKTNFEKIWSGYLEYKSAVIKVVPNESDLRDKDRWLWGKSFWEDLNSFIDK